ncbi:MAG: STAS domain-containing protein [Bacteroidota bacterium]
MEFSYSTSGQVGIYQLKGNLIGETDGISITESFSEQMEVGTKHFVIDLKELQHINSSGLGVLITLLTKARKSAGDVTLANPSSYINNLLLITKLNTIFQIHESREAAISTFSE